MGIIWETSFGVFLLVTVILAGGAGYMAGRSAASTWRPLGAIIGYAAALACAVRAANAALFQGTLFSLHYGVVDFIVILLIAALGYRITRTSQMVQQYSWMYERVSPFSWRARTPAGGA
jgi:hypothetical protein